MHRLSLIALCLAFAGSLAHAQPDTNALKSFVSKAQRDFALPSISVAVVKDGEVLMRINEGERSPEADLPATSNTMYAIASLSKAFTAAGIGMLVDEGKLEWTDRVIDILPWFALSDTHVTQIITVEDLLCHRSGLETFDGDLLWYGTTYSREEAIRRIRYRKLTHAFRDDFGYQNLMFMTAGEVIEAVSGMSWDDFISQRILKPLGMKRTTSSFDVFASDFNVAKPCINGQEIFMLSYVNSGATAALNSTANDMALWMNFWLNDGIVDGDTLLSKESIDRIWSLHTNLPIGTFDEKNGTHFKGYGLGWFLMDYSGKKIVHHGGGLPGYISKVALIPEDELGIVVLTNDMSGVPGMLMYALADWAQGKDLARWEETFLNFRARELERKSKAEEERLNSKEKFPQVFPVEDYIGVYSDSLYGEATVYLGKDGLMLTLQPAKELFTGPLTAWNKHSFRFDHNDPFLTYGIIEFDVQEDKIVGFHIDLPNDDFHFHKLYFRLQ